MSKEKFHPAPETALPMPFPAPWNFIYEKGVFLDPECPSHERSCETWIVSLP